MPAWRHALTVLRVVPWAALGGCTWTAPPPTQVTAAAEAYSLFGAPLVPTPPVGAARETLEVRLARARADYARDTTSAEALIWVGRRTAYLGRYREAIGLFSRGIADHPTDARMLRHRGHRYITLRLFDLAVSDLEDAARFTAGKRDQVEPDGIPNPRNTPTSTLQSNIWYHLGLAYYLEGDFENAHRCWNECLRFSNNPDQLCATTYWLWHGLTRLGRHPEARAALEPIRPGMDIIENHDYQRLLLLYQSGDSAGTGAAAESLLAAARREGGVPFATVAYGVGARYLALGQRERAVAVFRELLAATTWAAFGHIAAEADLHRMGVRP